jgi:hypothetical protein
MIQAAIQPDVSKWDAWRPELESARRRRLAEAQEVVYLGHPWLAELGVSTAKRSTTGVTPA